MLIQFFLILLATVVVLLVLGIKYQRWLLSLIATVFSPILALSAYRIEVVTGGITLVFQEGIIVMVCWLLMLVSLIATVIGVTATIRAQWKKDKKPQSAGGGAFAG